MTGLSVLIVDQLHPVLVEKLTRRGFDCHYLPEIKGDQVENIIHSYDGLVLRSKLVVGKSLINKAKKLKFIGRAGSGLENIDTAYATELGIACFNSPEGSRDAVGERCVGLLLALLNRTCQADSQVRSGKWDREANWGIELKGKTIGIIGYGNMGSAFALRLSGFNVQVISFDKYKYNYSDGNTTEVTLDQLFDQADILSLHVPLTAETHYMFCDKFIQKFRKNIWLLNTSRGEVVSTADLAANLKSGRILGAALDVLEYESKTFEDLYTTHLPDSYHYLINAGNVILSPHVAGWTNESNYKIADILAQKIIRFFIEQ
ncbi:MAG: NAD(P)-binding domain-containing protein [Bacteroidia bacterium]|nr:NAD(P)-binding domain-containing protein [Bacteroidia bacterium]